MPKAKNSTVKKRRVIIATILKKGEDTKTVSILEKLKEYNINTTRQTVITDKKYLSTQDLDEYICSDTGIPLEIMKDEIDTEITLNKKLRNKTEDLNIQANFSAIIRRLNVDKTNIMEKIEALRMTKIELEKPVYIITIGTQKEVDVKEYKKKRDKK